MKESKTLNMVYIAFGAALITICSWIYIPAAVPFTLQTFAIFALLGIFGGKRGTYAIVLYVMLGAIGLPVFSGFNGGFGALLGVTGGYIIGFVLSCLLYWLLTSLFGNKVWMSFFFMLMGLVVCYAFGTMWFMLVYTKSKGAVSIISALSMCVFPFIIPDIIKIVLAMLISRKVRGIASKSI